MQTRHFGGAVDAEQYFPSYTEAASAAEEKMLDDDIESVRIRKMQTGISRKSNLRHRRTGR